MRRVVALALTTVACGGTDLPVCQPGDLLTAGEDGAWACLTPTAAPTFQALDGRVGALEGTQAAVTGRVQALEDAGFVTPSEAEALTAPLATWAGVRSAYFAASKPQLVTVEGTEDELLSYDDVALDSHAGLDPDPTFGDNWIVPFDGTCTLYASVRVSAGALSLPRIRLLLDGEAVAESRSYHIGSTYLPASAIVPCSAGDELRFEVASLGSASSGYEDATIRVRVDPVLPTP